MGYSTASTEWPLITVPESVKQLVDTLFSLLDKDIAGVGDRLADEIFTADGVMEGHARAEGTAAIRKSRSHAWNIIKTRHHEIMKVYLSDTEATDLLLIGKVTAGLANGEVVPGEFVARIIVSGSGTEKPKIKLYQVWMDTAPITKALQNK